MKSCSALFLAKACNGKLFGNKEEIVTDVKIDSRMAGEGDMFVCVVGEVNNGHDYVNGAYGNGCRVFLMSDRFACDDLILEHKDAAVILVEDTVKAFEAMAKAYLSQFKIRTVGVTGSVGKTTTKMLTAAVLSAKYNTICTAKNLNTNLGICLTAFMADDTTEAIVFEMGMDKKGEIEEYVSFIKPELAIITNVGISHMERLGSRDAIADAKLEITSQFTEKNTLVVNALSDYLKTEEEIRERSVNKAKFEIKLVKEASNISNDGLNGVKYSFGGHEYVLPLIGEHNVIDACLAITAGEVFGITPEEAAKALSKVESTERRLHAEKINGVVLLDDSYNASPDSMKAGLAALASSEGKRKIAVLGDMYELGDAEEEGHFEVGRYAAEMGINMVIAVGENSSIYNQGVSSLKGSQTTVIELGTVESASSLICTLKKDGDVILVKGSNSTGISEVAETIRNKE